MIRSGAIFTFVAALGIVQGETLSSAEAVDSFSLPYWESDSVFRLEDHVDEILILDFFAYWCGPCLHASSDLERSVNQYFESREGNRAGIPVRVVSINVEDAKPEKTRAFIDRSGASMVLEDHGGRLLERFGGDGLPYFLILDGTKLNDGGTWEIAYRNSGYEGSSTFLDIANSIASEARSSDVDQEAYETALEQMPVLKGTGDIDSATNSDRNDLEASGRSLGAQSSMPSLREGGDFESVESRRLPESNSEYYDLSFGALRASDVEIYNASLLFNRGRAEASWDAAILYGRIDIDYEPVREADVIGNPAHRFESSLAGQFSFNLEMSPYLEYNISSGIYTGYRDHRSIWLDEYYYQQFFGVEGYEVADPWGYNLSLGAQWDSRSPLGLLSVTTSFLQDDVAPGYDKPLFEPLERGRERLYTGSLNLSAETVVSAWVRTLHEISLSKTTDREIRYGYRGLANFAINENLVARVEGAYTFEAVNLEGESDFRSYSAGLTLEYDWNQRWFLGMSGRFYDDNGQIETSILVSSGPPPLETSHYGIGLRWQGESASWKLSLASYETKFEELDTDIRPFGNLYSDRDWLIVELSFNGRF